MTFSIHVQGGTGAGRKRPLREARKPWTHPCTLGAVRELAGYLEVCPDCGTPRP